MVSSQTLQKLPDIHKLKLISKSIAMLDAIIMPEWEFRYYSFNSKWSNDEEVASMRDGSGDEYIILFNSYGAIIKGRFPEAGLVIDSIESQESYHKIFKQIPLEFKTILVDPAFCIDEMTFCLWSLYS